MSDQYLRKASLFLGQGLKGNSVLDLSEMQLQFRVNAADTQTPNTAFIRVLNLSADTAKLVKNEFSTVLLQAGYQAGNFGVIFDGSIIEVRKGRINPTDTFVDIFASDGDVLYNFGLVNFSLSRGTQRKEVIDKVVAGFNDARLTLAGPSSGDTVSYAPKGVILGATLPRGKAQFGMARDTMRDLARTAGTTWTLEGSHLVETPLTAYRPGDAVDINSNTGMLGIPEQTENGIIVRMLLNPLLQIGGRVHINNSDIIPGAVDLQYKALNNFASISADGFYKILVAEHRGDTRGSEWLTQLHCFSINVSAPIDKAVDPYGGLVLGPKGKDK
jgi:hypothetical protein